jgi:guanylate kinase
METPGTVFVISAPSGAGKTSLVQGVRRRVAGLGFSVSYTTRRPRPGEVHGEHYYFVDKQTFVELMGRGEFIEHALVFGEYYGTSKSQVRAMLQAGQDVILEIDWQGAQQARQAIPSCVSVFILPPSRHTLQCRLQGRGSEDPAAITKRLADAREEISHYNEYDYLIVNDDLQEAMDLFEAVIRVGRQRTAVQRIRQAALIQALLTDEVTG